MKRKDEHDKGNVQQTWKILRRHLFSLEMPRVKDDDDLIKQYTRFLGVKTIFQIEDFVLFAFVIIYLSICSLGITLPVLPLKDKFACYAMQYLLPIQIQKNANFFLPFLCLKSLAFNWLWPVARLCEL